ncbi:MAG: GlsB/YeaQ/YmgE family stress response membrane protein [candidate division KSB1 bacterium]|nr:GlsB/YeaQ/YmgE family stress response membrane protein [candidate division KSB1 bacterium]MDZ7300641.1 GlsB/YeaQ/YmgE family stress response membrane protein [candidate division KSB1 bacterium]MDZ7309778.1 GlsB/YeaQ/YmgE family stress response membrane protein [candidate division KSB1 bacterium]
MSWLDFLALLVVAGICGALGQAISGYSRGGCLIAIVIGFIGALIGMWLARQLDLPDILVLNFGTKRFPVLWSIIGSALFVALIGLLTTPRRRR